MIPRLKRVSGKQIMIIIFNFMGELFRIEIRLWQE